MKRPMIMATLVGAGVAATAGSVAAYKMLTKDNYAEVVSVTPLTEQVRTPRQVCNDVAVTRQQPVKDPNRVTGTVIGAIAGGVIGNELGGHGSNTGAKIAGAAVGGLAGNKIQQNMQQNATYASTEQRCQTVFDVSAQPAGYRVVYRLGDTTGHVQLDHDPGPRIPVRDGQLVIADAQTVPMQTDSAHGS